MVIPLILIQVSPLIKQNGGDDTHHGLSAPILKTYFSQTFSFDEHRIHWEDSSSSLPRGHVITTENEFNIPLPTYDPVNVHKTIPCWIQVYAFKWTENLQKVKADEGTMVQIIQSSFVCYQNDSTETNVSFTPNEMDDDYNLCIFNTYYGKRSVSRKINVSWDTQLVDSLTIRMNHLLQYIHYIGTTPHALQYFEQERKQRQQLSICWNNFFSHHHGDGKEFKSENANNKNHDRSNKIRNTMIGSCAALTIVNQHENISAIYEMIHHIAHEKLRCDVIHDIIPSLFFAKYGAQNTNIALECHLHNLVLNAAISSKSICLIFHDLESLESSTKNNPTAYKPTIHAIEAYTSQLVHSLTHKRHFVYPNKHAFYNVGSENHKGYVFPVRICLIGIFHAADDAKGVSKPISILGTNNQFHIPTAITEGEGDDTIKEEANNDVKDLSVSLASVGGNAEAKLALQDALATDPKTRAIFRKMNISLPTGILLYGPPGTGKTMLARAIVSSMTSSTEDRFISLNASQIVQSTIGSSEKLVAHTFERARKIAPSVIFIDEFQALFTNRSSGSSGRLTSTLLQCMDDLSKWRQASLQVNSNEDDRRIVVLAATNTPWMVDSAFLRYGRFDRIVHVGLPDIPEREHIFQIHLDRMRLDGSSKELSRDLANRCSGYSGADISALCRSAAIACLHDNCNHKGVSKKHFLQAQKNFSPSNSPQAIDRLRQWKKKQHSTL